MDFSLPHLICLYGRAVKGSLHQVGQVQCAEARFEIAVFCEPDFAEAQWKTDQAGGVNDEEVAICADAVDVSVSGEDGYDSGQVLLRLLGVARRCLTMPPGVKSACASYWGKTQG